MYNVDRLIAVILPGERWLQEQQSDSQQA
jgi:hypothetical protein